MRLTRREALGVLGIGAAAAVLPSLAFGAEEPSFPKGAIIRTILKDLPPGALAGGATLFHEHLSIAADFGARFVALLKATNPSGGATLPPPDSQPGQHYSMKDLDVMTDEMRAAAHDGVACIVDAGHPDMGRDWAFLKALATKSALPIVAGYGYYTEPFYPPEIARWSDDQIAQELIRQAHTQPVGAFGEIGSWDEITDNERKVFRAVGKAHVATNLPIFTHTGIPGKSAMEQLDILESEGVLPQHVVIGHLGNLVDPKVEVHKAICKRGAFVGFDRQGGPNDAQQVPMVLALIEAGYADHLMFSSDSAVAGQLKKNGGPGYGKTLTVWAPKLREAGVNEKTLHGILVDNPRRFLAFVPKKPRKS